MAQLLIDEIPIYLESALLILPFYYFLFFLSIKLHKIVDSISCFPYNSTKYEFRITLEIWQIGGL
jgi:hypothetical protein